MRKKKHKYLFLFINLKIIEIKVQTSIIIVQLKQQQQHLQAVTIQIIQIIIKNIPVEVNIMLAEEKTPRTDIVHIQKHLLHMRNQNQIETIKKNF